MFINDGKKFSISLHKLENTKLNEIIAWMITEKPKHVTKFDNGNEYIIEFEHNDDALKFKIKFHEEIY